MYSASVGCGGCFSFIPSRPTNSNPVPFFGTGFFGKAIKAYSQFAASVSCLPTGLAANPSLATGQFFCYDVSEPSHTERPNDLNSTMTETEKKERHRCLPRFFTVFLLQWNRFTVSAPTATPRNSRTQLPRHQYNYDRNYAKRKTPYRNGTGFEFD